MAIPTTPGVSPSEAAMDGRTGAMIRMSTDTRKASAKSRASGVTASAYTTIAAKTKGKPISHKRHKRHKG